MKVVLARTSSVLRRLTMAVPDAWRDDAVFRWSSIGAGACLLARLLNSGSKQLASLPSDAPSPSLPSPALATPPVPTSVPSPSSVR